MEVDINTIKTLAEGGSFMVLVAGLALLAWVGVHFAKRISAAAEKFLAAMHASYDAISQSVSKIQIDSAAHYAKDDVVQSGLQESIDHLHARVEAEHAETRKVIIEAVERGR